MMKFNTVEEALIDLIKDVKDVYIEEYALPVEKILEKAIKDIKNIN